MDVQVVAKATAAAAIISAAAIAAAHARVAAEVAAIGAQTPATTLAIKNENERVRLVVAAEVERVQIVTAATAATAAGTDSQIDVDIPYAFLLRARTHVTLRMPLSHTQRILWVQAHTHACVYN